MSNTGYTWQSTRRDQEARRQLMKSETPHTNLVAVEYGPGGSANDTDAERTYEYVCVLVDDWQGLDLVGLPAKAVLESDALVTMTDEEAAAVGALPEYMEDDDE